jgi:hypothetical protein
VGYDKWLFYERYGPANLSDFPDNKIMERANIRHRNGTWGMLPLMFTLFHLLKMLIVSHTLIFPGHSVPLKIILNNCSAILNKCHVIFFSAKAIILRK